MTNTLLSPDRLVAQWRASADDDNPAGPLFSHGYTESELTIGEIVARTTLGCSECTASARVQCC
jgi:hypothetical protein